jgi:hypothetical protein
MAENENESEATVLGDGGAGDVKNPGVLPTKEGEEGETVEASPAVAPGPALQVPPAPVAAGPSGSTGASGATGAKESK